MNSRICLLSLIFTFLPCPPATAQTNVNYEVAYRANNRGVALLEQYKYQEGAKEFRRALATAPDMFLARLNLAIALYNVPDLDAATTAAAAALQLKPASPHAQYVLGLIAKSQTRTDDALAAFQRVRALDPADTGANINVGQLLSQQRSYAEAAHAFRQAVAAEPYNTSALYGLGQALLRAGAREEGQAVMQTFQKYRQSSSGTTLSNNYLEQGRYAEAIASTGAESDLVEKSLPKVSFQGEKPVFKRGKKRDGSKLFIGKSFVSLFQAKPSSRYDILQRLSGGMTLLDFDADGDLDQIEAGTSITNFKRDKSLHTTAKVITYLTLQRNDRGKFVYVTTPAGDLEQTLDFVVTSIVAGDFDNDGLPDLFVLGYQNMRLYRNEGKGRFKDVTKDANLPKYEPLALSCAFVDADHDGDLDIFVAGFTYLDSRADLNDYTFPLEFGSGLNLLLRNNGNSTFTDISETAGVNSKLKNESDALGRTYQQSIAVVPTDYDNHRDIDLLVVNYGGKINLFRNLRDGTFRDVADEAGLPAKGNWTCAAAGDFNKDGFTDFFFGREAGLYVQDSGTGVFAVSDGQGKFRLQDAPKEAENAVAAQFVDYDNDGLLDLLTTNSDGLQVIRNVGDGWQVGPKNTVFHVSNDRVLLAADFDADGDTDLLTRWSQGVIRNEGGNCNNSVRVNLKGFVGNRSGIGAKVDIRAGSLGQKLEYYSASPAPAPSDIVFGLGKRQVADAVRIVWPSGIVQAEIAGLDTLARKPLAVTELDLKPSSCPYLYTWNGGKFEFITDFMGGGEMGYWLGPGAFNQPDPDEYVRLTDKQLQPKGGRYEIRVTNELEEVLFVDHLKLITVAHPADTEVYPDEGLGHAPYPSPLKLYQTQGAQPPLAAVDDTGANVLPELSAIDRKYPSNFVLDKVRGYAAEHSLTLQIPDVKFQISEPNPQSAIRNPQSENPQSENPQSERVLLLMNGWTDYAFSSDNVAASHGGKAMKPPALQVKDKAGNWQTVIADIGIPIGRPQTVTVDLTGKFLSESREIRIVTNMRIYYDQILVGMRSAECGMRNCADGGAMQVTELAPVVADLHWRGFSAAIPTGGNVPDSYDYAQVSWASPWKVAPGRYTRKGDVRELLANSDDSFVISRVGDEIRLSFDAKQLPPLPEGWKRTFLLYGDGFSKELDINSATPHGIGPLPFHGMTKYPYEWPEAYPLTPEREALLERYNTRIVRSELATLVGMK